MSYLSSSDLRKTNLGRWWLALDRWTFLALISLILIGILLNFAGTPLIAKKLGYSPYYLVQKQLIFLGPSILVVLFVSMLSPIQIRNISFIGTGVIFILLIATLFMGVEIKGAKRWISLIGISIQPSEFIKPFFSVCTAWLFYISKTQNDTLGKNIATGFFIVFASLLLLQPDLGMTFILGSIWFSQLFVVGLPMIYIATLIGFGLAGMLSAYLFLPHVTSRINRFLDPNTGDNYQINKSLEAFSSGGFFGKGPGEGTIKAHLPDAHADFIFSVAGEEYGFLVCMLILFLYAFIVIRCLWRLHEQNNLFSVLAGVGLCIQFGMQAFVNMASSLRMIPTKGMTLPFLSYGGSSLLALSLGMGILLALTRTTRTKRS